MKFARLREYGFIVLYSIVAFALTIVTYFNKISIWATIASIITSVYFIFALYGWWIERSKFKKSIFLSLQCFISLSIPLVTAYFVTNFYIILAIDIIFIVSWLLSFFIKIKRVTFYAKAPDEYEFVNKQKVVLYLFFGIALMYSSSVATLIFGKTQWFWIPFFLPIQIISLSGVILYFNWCFIWAKTFKITITRNVINIVCFVTSIILCFVFSDDDAYLTQSGSINLILVVITAVLFSIAFSTGHKCMRIMQKERKQLERAYNDDKEDSSIDND